MNDAYGGSPSNDRYGPGQSGQQTTTFNTHGHFAAGPAPGLVVSLTEDAWLGDAHYRLAVDGVDRGGIRTESVLRTGGQGTDRIDLGALPSGQHSVEVTFINEAYSGSPSTDRNLYLAGATYDGTPVQDGSAALMGDGTYTFSVMATPPVGAAPSATLPADSSLPAISSAVLGAGDGACFLPPAHEPARDGPATLSQIAQMSVRSPDLLSGVRASSALQRSAWGRVPIDQEPAPPASWSLDLHGLSSLHPGRGAPFGPGAHF